MQTRQECLTAGALVCIDVAPFRRQLCTPYVKGKMDDWIVKSGQESIDCFVNFVKSMSGVDVEEGDALVIIRRSLK